VAYLPSRRAFIGALGGGHSPRNDATGSDFSMRPRQGDKSTLSYARGYARLAMSREQIS